MEGILEPMQAYDLSKLSILVLEKHLLLRRLLTDVFREFGVPSIQSTADPAVAFQMFQSPMVATDIVLCDWAPDLDGMAFLDKLRKDPDSPNPFVPVIVCTANTELKNVCTARDRGMTEFLAKPVSAKLIYSRIVAVIEHNRPFIKVGGFFGLDRRRRGADHGGEERRRRFSA